MISLIFCETEGLIWFPLGELISLSMRWTLLSKILWMPILAVQILEQVYLFLMNLVPKFIQEKMDWSLLRKTSDRRNIFTNTWRTLDIKIMIFNFLTVTCKKVGFYIFCDENFE